MGAERVRRSEDGPEFNDTALATTTRESTICGGPHSRYLMGERAPMTDQGLVALADAPGSHVMT